MIEQTLIIVKPDGVARGLVGTILERLERTGLTITQLKLVQADEELIGAHYPAEEAWLASVGTKTLQDYERQSLDPRDTFGRSDARAIGCEILSWLHQY